MAGEITIYPYNILNLGTLSVTGTPDTGYPAARLGDHARSLYWKDTVTEAKNITVNQGASAILSVDTLIIDIHNFVTDFQWQYSTDNFVADTNAAVPGWTQADTAQIVKTFSPALDRQYWRLAMASMVNPRCTEVYMSAGFTFDVYRDADALDVANVQWNQTVGGSARATKFGDEKRSRTYIHMLESADYTNFQTAVGYTKGYSLPFYIKDHESNYFLAKFLSPPVFNYQNPNFVQAEYSVVEI